MRNILVIPLLALAACGPGRACEEAFLRTRVTIRLKDSTLRQFLDEMEIQTGFPIARQCSCGMLQEVLDQPGFNLSLADVPALAALQLGIIGHRGGWAFERDRAVLHCGLAGPARPIEGRLKRMLFEILGIP